ncbi:MAG: alanine racemase [Betaproteobacteria bacterium]|uniref:Alanine racemase n=1 Tax=Candidatus Proximibacter danicus TaxID=2954365 RepID=A0A9D7PSX0_9PROT|nr:alanine racemase [Candidatus Proximibacter danicus]
MPRPIRARIDRAALLHNYLLAKTRAPGARAWAVVKANAYGHGLMHAAEALADAADGFALLDREASVALRQAGLRQPILLLEGFFSPEDLELVADHRLSVVVHRLEQLQILRQVGLPVRVPVYVKLNTGMNRLGFPPAALGALRDELAKSQAVGEITLMTHFAEADSARGIDWQLQTFAAMAGEWRGPVSLANSAAILRYPKVARDWVRPGIMLYGGSPFAEQSAESLGLRPVMTLASEIIAVQTLAAGERIGYGGLFVAERETRVGVVACGYADGYPRHAPTGTPVLVGGRRSRTLGRVSMDMLAVDLTDFRDAGVGSPVTLWGEGLPADEVAAAAGTISYELFCALARRVPVEVA